MYTDLRCIQALHFPQARTFGSLKAPGQSIFTPILIRLHLPRPGPRPRPRPRRRNISQSLPNPDLLPRMHPKFKISRRLKHQHNRAAEPEATHLLPGYQGLPAQDRRRGCVCGFGVCTRWRASAADVRAEFLVDKNLKKGNCSQWLGQGVERKESKMDG